MSYELSGISKSLKGRKGRSVKSHGSVPRGQKMRAVEVQGDTYAIVQRAWTATLPSSPFDPDQSWEDAGADSLKSLHLVMRLEKALGRKVPFDLISREMTAADLADRLDRDAIESEVRQVSGRSQTVFYVPGLYGDDTTQADFRRSFGEGVIFEVVELPDLDASTSVLSDMAETGRIVADGITKQASEADIYLAGYSFGGGVAFEAAHALKRSGRNVRFIGIFDTVLDPAFDGFVMEEQASLGAGFVPAHTSVEKEPGRVRRLLPKKGEGPVTWFDRVWFAGLMGWGKLETARRAVLRSRNRVTPELLVNRRKFVLGMCRRKAIQSWRPETLNVPALVTCSDDGARQNLLARWEPLCPGARTLHMPCGHMDVIKPPARGLLVTAVKDALAQASSAER